MKRSVFLLAIVLLLVPHVDAVTSSLKDVYAPRETMIGELTGGILGSISRQQVRVVKDEHLDVAVQYDVSKIGNKYYIWLVAPANVGDYTLIIEDVVAMINGVPEVVEFRKDFLVQGAGVDFSVSPGFVVTSTDFEILATAYNGVDIEVHFPESRTISLYPGINRIDFSIDNILGVVQTTINIGGYQIPARIVGAKYICGDGRVDDREVCDGSNLNGKNCTSIPGGFASGQLLCSGSCLSFDSSLCKLPSNETPIGNKCDINHLSLCLNQTSCAGVGGFWYNNSCNKYEQGANCDSNQKELCLTQGTCLDAGGYWYNNSCNVNPVQSCGSDHKELCLTQGTCLDAGGYWYNNSCNVNPEIILKCGDGIISPGEECDGTNLSLRNCTSVGFDYGNLSCVPKGLPNECKFNVSGCYLIPPARPPVFIVDPAQIKAKVLLGSDFPVYRFKITNTGTSEIVGLRLDYNPNKFIIVPYEANISVNASVEFNVTVKEAWKGTAFKGAIIAYTQDVYEFVLMDFALTRNATDAVTEYRRNNASSGPSYYCSELSGGSCGEGQTCKGNTVPTIDVERCCVGSCENPAGSSGGSAWIGYLIAGIVLLGIIIIYVMFKKKGASGGSPLKPKIIQAKAALP